MLVKKSFRGIPIPFMCMLINFRPLSIFDFYQKEVQRAPPLIINKDLLAWRATKAFYTLTQPLLILLASSWNIDQHGHFQAHSRWFLENSLQKGKEEAAWSILLLFTWTATTPCKYFMGSSCCSIFLLSFNDILVLGFPFFPHSLRMQWVAWSKFNAEKNLHGI